MWPFRQNNCPPLVYAISLVVKYTATQTQPWLQQRATINTTLQSLSRRCVPGSPLLTRMKSSNVEAHYPFHASHLQHTCRYEPARRGQRWGEQSAVLKSSGCCDSITRPTGLAAAAKPTSHLCCADVKPTWRRQITFWEAFPWSEVGKKNWDSQEVINWTPRTGCSWDQRS